MRESHDLFTPRPSTFCHPARALQYTKRRRRLIRRRWWEPALWGDPNTIGPLGRTAVHSFAQHVCVVADRSQACAGATRGCNRPIRLGTVFVGVVRARIVRRGEWVELRSEGETVQTSRRVARASSDAPYHPEATRIALDRKNIWAVPAHRLSTGNFSDEGPVHVVSQ